MKMISLSIAGVSSMLLKHWGPFGWIVMLFFVGIFLILWRKEVDEDSVWLFSLDKYFSRTGQKAWISDINHWAYTLEGEDFEEIKKIKVYEITKDWCIKARRR